jgi:hypothetical protein
MVSFIVNGVIKPVIVDEWLPLFFGEEYTKKKSGAIWHFLLEKAWAKLNGSYMRTVQDDAKITSQHFLGMPAFSIDHSTQVDGSIEFFRELCKYD